MAENRKIVKVFLGSPGDLSPERQAAKGVVDELNTLLAEPFGYLVELVRWENAVSVFGRPQETINRELERCELFIGIMWRHWGTAPDVSGPYSSGFEEEFDISVQSRLAKGRPEISLLFKDVDPELLRDPGDELKKVIGFQNRCKAEKKILFQTFSDMPEFERKLRSCIWSYVVKLHRESGEESEQSASPNVGHSKQKTGDKTHSTSDTPLSEEGSHFLRDFISKTEKDGKSSVTSVEVARFRLLAYLIGVQGNDERTLGVHDANLIFAEREKYNFSNREKTALLESGLGQFLHANTPVWYWLSAMNGFTRQLLSLYSVAGKNESLIGALNAMKLISAPLKEDPSWERAVFLRDWLAKDKDSDVKIAALSYLGDCGVPADLVEIQKELEGNDNRTINAATDAIIRIKSRDSREKAVIALFDLQPSSIDENLLKDIFSNDAAITTETLLNGINHKNSKVRCSIVRILSERCELPDVAAKSLILDGDAAVRYEALKSLAKSGEIFSEAEAKHILVKPEKAMSLLGTDGSGETCWKDYRRQSLRLMSDEKLEQAVLSESIFEREAHFILHERNFSRTSESLRKNVDDQYKEYFSDALQSMAKKYGEQSDLIEKTAAVGDVLRKEFTRQGLDVICRKAQRVDIGRVRKALISGDIDYSPNDAEYLRRFGEWEDIPLLINIVKRRESNRLNSLLISVDGSKHRAVARAIHTLGRTRLQELLQLPMPHRLRSHIIVEIPDKAYRALSDHSLNLLFNLDGELVRKAAALKCVKALTKGRIARLLTQYISTDETRYYNVIHWLDFGCSAPRDHASRGAEKEIANDWLT